jgi:hypothetical protein
MTLTVQEAIAARTEEAFRDLFTSARRMPADKLNWQPLGEGRTALNQLQECATAPLFYTSVLTSEPLENMREVRKSWDIDECERRGTEATERLTQIIRSLSDERLTTQLEVPKNGTLSVIDVVWMHLANLTYHLGAINYIQTLYGDLEMD